MTTLWWVGNIRRSVASGAGDERGSERESNAPCCFFPDRNFVVPGCFLCYVIGSSVGTKFSLPLRMGKPESDFRLFFLYSTHGYNGIYVQHEQEVQ
jgi:hypothetical protein